MKERYDGLDGLRAISCLGIIAMHIRANAEYAISGWIYDCVVPSLTLFVYLFLMISGFGMFCGYYDRFRQGSVDLNRFYARRYGKILPFFAFLLCIDVIMDRSAAHLIEGITEATLVFGLLPNNQPDVIGVGWTLGVIFLFYMLFPFFVFLCWNKRRAWISLFISCVLNLFCDGYYFSGKFVIESFAPRHNFLYCAPFFIIGGLIWMYRSEINAVFSSRKVICFAVCAAVTAGFFLAARPGLETGLDLNRPGILPLILVCPWLVYAVSCPGKLLNNRIVGYLSRISLELYLAQMVVFRAFEKMHCLYLLGKGWLSFILVWIGVVAGLILFIEIWSRLWKAAIRISGRKRFA